MDVTLKILRGSGPLSSGKPEGEVFSTFNFDVSEESTILDLLMEAGLQDTGLLFRHSCHHGSCGTCACIIDGTERLACRTALSLFEDGALIEIRPLNGFPRIKDLVTDPGGMFEKIGEQWNYVRESKEGGVRFENCIECGACISACPVTGPFQGPAPLALLHRKLESLDEKSEAIRRELIDQASARDGVAACRRHIECSRVCPQNVAPARRIQQLRRVLEQN